MIDIALRVNTAPASKKMVRQLDKLERNLWNFYKDIVEVEKLKRADSLARVLYEGRVTEYLFGLPVDEQDGEAFPLEVGMARLLGQDGVKARYSVAQARQIMAAERIWTHLRTRLRLRWWPS